MAFTIFTIRVKKKRGCNERVPAFFNSAFFLSEIKHPLEYHPEF
jgi:hypothetical protein